MDIIKMKKLMEQENDIKYLIKQIKKADMGKDIEDIIENNNILLDYLRIFLETRRKNESR